MNKSTLITVIAVAILIVALGIFAFGGVRDILPFGKSVAAPRAVARLLEKGDDAGALKEISLILEKDPASPRAEAGFFAIASFYENRADLIKARDAYQKVIEKFPASANITKAQEAIENINMKMLFSPTVANDAIIYEVRKGDSLARIAKRFNTTIDLIVKSNNLKSTQINVGKKLRINKEKFSIFVDKSQNILILKADGNIVKTYRVSTGQNNSTPVGTFKIVNKIVDPPWYTTGAVIPAGSPKNILGTRWMGISAPTYGIHGTTEPQSIGRSVTAGCVRMRNSDVEELYSIVPEGTEVVIVD